MKDLFYLRPKALCTLWYNSCPVGVHKLKKYVACMCARKLALWKNMNHTLKATKASALFNAGIPEKMIREVTGHRSNALQLYERPAVEQQ